MTNKKHISHRFRLDDKIALITGASNCSGGKDMVDGGYSAN